MQKNALLAGLLLLGLAGAYFVYDGMQPYPIVDMNGDGKIDWKDYDVNGDGRIDMGDLVTVATAYGSSIGDVRYDSRLDFNRDGVIGDYDVNAIKDYFGQGLDIVGLIGYRLTTPKGVELVVGLTFIAVALIIAFKKRRS